MRFLISRLSSLGDVVCSLPAAGALKAAFPESEVHWIVDPRFADVVACCRHVDVVHAVASRRLEGEFEVALDLQGLLKSAWPLARVRATRKLGYHWQREGAWLFTTPVRPDPTSFHIVDQYVDVARAAGGLAGGAEFGLEPDANVLEALKAKLPDRPFVALNAGAGWVTKRWPAPHFAHVAEALSQQGISSVLIGGRATADREAADAVLAAAKATPVDLLGQTNIRELIALLSLAKAHVGGDTGSTHLMAALGRPAIGLYSITRPKRSCPYGQIERCHYDPAGLALISPDAVMLTVQEALAC